jgi:hypothetical protein
MPYTLSFNLNLGSSQTGLTLKAALMDTAGTIHATIRDIATGFVEVGAGNYLWSYTLIPDGYRGCVVFYTGVLGVAANFAGVVVKTEISVNPEEAERVDVLVSSRLATAGYTVPPTAVQIRTELDANSTRLAILARLQAQSNAQAVALAFAAMQSERVDVIGVADSNQLQGGNGWDHGWQYALSRRAYMYATALMGAAQNGVNGAAAGYKYTAVNTSAIVTGATAELEAYALQLYPHNYHYGAMSGFAINGMQVDADCPINVNANLTSEMHYGTFPGGAHTFRPGIRYNDGDYQNLVFADLTDAATGAYGMARLDMQLTALARNRSLDFRWGIPGLYDAVGAYFGYIRVINTDRPRGFSYHTLTGLGGYSLADIITTIRTLPGANALSYWASQIRRLQGATKRLIFILNSGLNDRNEALASTGPRAEADGDSPEAFADNCEAFIHEIRKVWTTNGWPQEELYFVLMPSHVVGNPDDAELITYRVAAEQVAGYNSQTVAVDLGALMTNAEAVAGSWYLPGDPDHLSATGTQELATRALDRIMAPLTRNFEPLDRTNLGAVKTKTDQLTFHTGGYVRSRLDWIGANFLFSSDATNMYNFFRNDGFASTAVVDDLIDIAVDAQDAATAAQSVDGKLTTARAGYLDKLNVAGTLAHTGNADTFKADVSGLLSATAFNNRMALAVVLPDPAPEGYGGEGGGGGGGLTVDQDTKLTRIDTTTTKTLKIVQSGR